MLARRPALEGFTPITTTIEVPNVVEELYVIGEGEVKAFPVGDVRITSTPSATDTRSWQANRVEEPGETVTQTLRKRHSLHAHGRGCASTRPIQHGNLPLCARYTPTTHNGSVVGWAKTPASTRDITFGRSRRRPREKDWYAHRKTNRSCIGSIRIATFQDNPRLRTGDFYSEVFSAPRSRNTPSLISVENIQTHDLAARLYFERTIRTEILFSRLSS